MASSIIMQNEPVEESKKQEDKDDPSKTMMMISRFRRGECSATFSSVAIAICLGSIGALAFIGYVIYVYGFNCGNWTPGQGDTTQIG